MAKLLINVTHGKARGFEPDGDVEPAQPGKLVEFALVADRVLTY